MEPINHYNEKKHIISSIPQKYMIINIICNKNLCKEIINHDEFINLTIFLHQCHINKSSINDRNLIKYFFQHKILNFILLETTRNINNIELSESLYNTTSNEWMTNDIIELKCGISQKTSLDIPQNYKNLILVIELFMIDPKQICKYTYNLELFNINIFQGQLKDNLYDELLINKLHLMNNNLKKINDLIEKLNIKRLNIVNNLNNIKDVSNRTEFLEKRIIDLETQLETANLSDIPQCMTYISNLKTELTNIKNNMTNLNKCDDYIINLNKIKNILNTKIQCVTGTLHNINNINDIEKYINEK
jgi:hypothetical protein